EPGAMPALHRYFGNPALSGIGRLFFGSPCGDVNCGLRGFNKRAIMRLNLCTTGMEFAGEMVVKATLQGLSISEVPTTLSPDGRGRPPHLRTWRDGWRNLRFLLMYSPRWLFLYPGFALMLLGAVVTAWLLPGPRGLGPLTLDVHTLLYASAAILIGFQAVLFAVFTKVFATSVGLLPPDAKLRRLSRPFTLELGLLVGLALIVGGLVGSVVAVRVWAGRAFGPLEYAETLRLVIPAALATALGCQIVLSSFFLSVLGLNRK
ncbi:MAG: glycosyltransferase family 2 protein, partial [Planctomycetota bacterium]